MQLQDWTVLIMPQKSIKDTVSALDLSYKNAE